MTPIGIPRMRASSAVDPAERVRDFARVQVRAGLLDEQGLVVEVAEAAEAELNAIDAATFAHRLVTEVRDELAVEQQDWPETTDYDRLQTVFRELQQADIVVLQGVDDHWSAKRELERLDGEGQRARGIAWFTAPDVWHAVDHGMLEVNLWHGDTANAAPGDELLEEVLAAFIENDLSAHFDEGRIEVRAYWQRRLPD